LSQNERTAQGLKELTLLNKFEKKLKLYLITKLYIMTIIDFAN